MKKALGRIAKLMVMLAVVVSFLPAAFAEQGWDVKEKVEVKWKGDWYTATVLKVKDGKYFVHYEGYGSDDDEWVAFAAMRNWYGVGSKVEVKWKGDWYPSKVLKVKDGKYFIHYDGYGSDDDQWVARNVMRYKGDSGSD